MELKVVVIGVSLGGLSALKVMLPLLPASFSMPVIIVQHVGDYAENYWIEIFESLCMLAISEAEEKEEIKKGNIYVAPPGYHLLIEKDKTFSLSADERVNFARPSIDVLFESAAEAFGKNLIGIILTGASADGARGLKKIKKSGGMAIVQDPATAESEIMPAAAIAATEVDYVLPLNEITDLLIKLNEQS